MIDLLDIPYYFFVTITVLSLFVTVLNLVYLDSLGDFGDDLVDQHNRGTVSILVPARNEEQNIGYCLESLVAQKYEPLEIIILDDLSTDDTGKVINEYVEADKRVRMIPGTEPPSGWVGKNWACHQLSRQTRGDFLLFVDADTILSDRTVSDAVEECKRKAIDLLTLMPRRMASSITEKLLFPFLDWASFCWMPMKAAHKGRSPNLSATFGQFMLFKRESYMAIGGHEAIRNNPLDDLELGRVIKKLGLKWKLLTGGKHVQVQAYRGNFDAFKGVSRSVFPALHYSSTLLVLFAIVLLGLGVVPTLTVAVGAISYPYGSGLSIRPILLICMVGIPWFVVCLKFKHNAIMVLFYPLSIVLMVAVGLHSFITHALGFANWKERRITGRRWRL